MENENTLPRVLLVDDQPSILRTLARILRRDFDVVTALSGEAALVLLGDNADFVVIVSDMSMGPGMDGNGFFEAVREDHPHLVERFFFFTGEPERCRGGRVFDKGGDIRPLLDAIKAI